MKRHSVIALGVLTALSLSACGSTSLFNRERPDEFAVQRQAPLVVPPDFALTPPAHGAPRPGSDSAAEQTLRALVGGPSARSASEAAVIGSAGGARSDPGIRSLVGSETTNVVDKGTVTRDIVSAPQGDGREASASVPGA